MVKCFRYAFHLNLDQPPIAVTSNLSKVGKLYGRLKRSKHFGPFSGVKVLHIASGRFTEVQDEVDLYVLRKLDESIRLKRPRN